MPSYAASKAKNEFGRLLERATRGEPVAITKHAVTKAYPISADQYHALRQEPEQKLFWRMYVAILRIIHGD
jgi:prevent-host-death family protein